jgi:hypothetical protein
LCHQPVEDDGLTFHAFLECPGFPVFLHTPGPPDVLGVRAFSPTATPQLRGPPRVTAVLHGCPGGPELALPPRGAVYCREKGATEPAGRTQGVSR